MNPSAAAGAATHARFGRIHASEEEN